VLDEPARAHAPLAELNMNIAKLATILPQTRRGLNARLDDERLTVDVVGDSLVFDMRATWHR
jgi:hypothetical protein